MLKQAKMNWSMLAFARLNQHKSIIRHCYENEADRWILAGVIWLGVYILQNARHHILRTAVFHSYRRWWWWWWCRRNTVHLLFLLLLLLSLLLLLFLLFPPLLLLLLFLFRFFSLSFSISAFAHILWMTPIYGVFVSINLCVLSLCGWHAIGPPTFLPLLSPPPPSSWWLMRHLTTKPMHLPVTRIIVGWRIDDGERRWRGDLMPFKFDNLIRLLPLFCWILSHLRECKNKTWLWLKKKGKEKEKEFMNIIWGENVDRNRG